MSDKDLLDASYLLRAIEGALLEASESWWRTEALARKLTDASAGMALVVHHLAETEVPVPPDLIGRANGWATDRPPRAELRRDRDQVLRLTGVVDFLIEQRGLDGTATRAEWFSSDGGPKWERVRTGRAKIRKNHNAG